ncbi:uncharacterized protein LOC129894424 [Solanum dulcamara]|uniref:uncharacterized protein LOC129894424 n=1 Tax=Solanum dulcamara TaxID=45834 RepID=UPI002484FA76|nr:uncharacterized protein LOC129894424 [Solanum dulcamara]XP_055826097.1 uncharacterized protein LOC129894424 [Solanum dulcamara]
MLQNRMVNASATCWTVEQELKEEKTLNVNIAEISAELQREKQKNAKLMERISILESHIQEKHKDFNFSNGNASSQSIEERHFIKLKRQKVARCIDSNEDRTRKLDSEVKDHTEIFLTKDIHTEHCLVNWMSMGDTQFLNFEISKDRDSAEDNNPDNSENDQESDGSGTYTDIVDTEDVKSLQIEETEELKVDICEASDPPVLESCDHHADPEEKSSPTDMDVSKNARGLGNCNNEEINMLEAYKEFSKTRPIDYGIRLQGSESSHKKSLKMEFCPKEVTKMLGSKELSLENAQSHTMRKILVFAPLGLRHGSEDMYELDFNHFSIFHKGEPYIDSKDPGEHVLYDNPGFQRKIFYPNRHNPTLCPVKILEEERAMRPSDATCPSCLFLCIKYGGRTRNLPQNEYVRQRMGRKKLKSFGPVICRMAMLIHIRSGSFFFKALGITLLFMAGFPNDLVQRETKYKNLDLLQKYYRTDEDAEREELFLSHSETDAINISPNSEQGKKAWTKTKSKREAISKSKTSEKATTIHSDPSCSAPPPAPFGLMGHASSPSQMTKPIQAPPHAPADMQKPVMVNTASNIHYLNQCSYPVFPIYPPNSVMPFVYWPQPNAFVGFPYPSSYRYIAPTSCISVHPYSSYYSHMSYHPLIPETLGTEEKQNGALDEAKRESNSSSSSTDSREK